MMQRTHQRLLHLVELGQLNEQLRIHVVGPVRTQHTKMSPGARSTRAVLFHLRRAAHDSVRVALCSSLAVLSIFATLCENSLRAACAVVGTWLPFLSTKMSFLRTRICRQDVCGRQHP